MWLKYQTEDKYRINVIYLLSSPGTYFFQPVLRGWGGGLIKREELLGKNKYIQYMWRLTGLTAYRWGGNLSVYDDSQFVLLHKLPVWSILGRVKKLRKLPLKAATFQPNTNWQIDSKVILSVRETNCSVCVKSIDNNWQVSTNFVYI